MKLRKSILALSAGALVACGAAAGWLAPAWVSSARAAAAEAPAESSVSSGPIPLGYAPNYTAIVAQNRDAVVTITSKSIEHSFGDSQGQNPCGSDSPFNNNPFFQFFCHGMPGMPQNVPVQSLGSGFVVRSDGVILTNAHVVRNATHVSVMLSNDHQYTAKVVGLDIPSDIAVLKIDARDLPTVRLGNSDTVQVGNYVLAVGAPYGLKESATAGIVSAIDRPLEDDSYVPFIQTDVAVNPGNSGGPLFNEHGAVIGINSQIYSNTGGFEGVSFAIPINVAISMERQILAHGKVEHALLGVEVQSMNQTLAGSFKLQTADGALVAKVEPDSAASRAGIRAGDVILKFDGHPVDGPESLQAAVGLSTPGTPANLDIWRNGRSLTLHVTLGNAASKAQLASNSGSSSSSPSGEHASLGLTVRPLTAGERAQAGVPSGLLVENATGPAASAGIQAGDIVLSADGTPVDSIEQLRRIVSHHKHAIALLVQHGNQREFVPVQLS